MLTDDLRSVPVFSDLADDELEWLAAQMTPVNLSPGDVYIREGTPADRMTVLFEGEVRLRIESANSEAAVRILRAPMVTGMLPYSRMTQFPATIRAVTATRVATFPAALFPEMLARVPVLGPRLVGLLSDRIRDFTKLQDQQEKLAALGKISAGLAHELNNPAAAARRAVATLREAFATLREAVGRLEASRFRHEQRVAIRPWSGNRRAAAPAPMDSLERSDCEEAVAACLLRHGVAQAWELAPALVEAGCEAAWFDRVYQQFPAEAWPDILSRIAVSLSIGGLLDEIENSTGRISELVRAIKEYSYMDQGPDQEVDIHQGLESTLLMLRHRLKTWRHGKA